MKYRLLPLVVAFAAMETSFAQDTTYEDWQSRNFTAAELTDDSVSGLLASPRNDGFSNLLKYALGLDVGELPTGPIPALQSTHPFHAVSIDCPEGLTDVTYRFYFSNTPGSTSWQEGTNSTQSLGNGRQRITANSTLANTGIGFARLEVEHDSGVIVSPGASNLTASPSSATEVLLEWEGGDDGTGFLIEKENENGDFEIIAFTSPGTTNYLATGLPPGSPANFRVRATGLLVDNTETDPAAATPMIGPGGIILLKHNNENPNSGNAINFRFELENTTSETIPLNEFRIIYWFSRDGTSSINPNIYFGQIPNNVEGYRNITGNIDAEIIDYPTFEDPSASSAIIFDINGDAGNLIPNGGTAFFFGAAQASGGGGTSATNDYSHQSGSLELNPKVALYRNGQLLLGTPPSGITGGPSRPTSPIGLEACALGESSIQLSWQDMANNEQIFVIERDFAEDPEGFSILTTLEPNEVSFQDLDLLDVATYSYRVRAVNTDGASAATNVASATTLDGVSPRFIPPTPEDLAVTTFSDGRLDLDWKDASRNEKGFMIERSVAGGPFELLANVGPGIVQYVDFGLDPSTTYSYRLVAYNNAGDSPATVAEAGTTQAPITPGPPTDAEIVRFLRHATFGATPELVSEVRSMGFGPWIDAQFALTPTLHRPLTQAGGGTQEARVEAWWNVVLTADDQVRQRLAFALSQIFVVSQQDADLADEADALAHYYDMLVAAPETNFRTLIEQISFSPVMGNYLDHTRNLAAGILPNVNPDENYAREIMQLFSIGLTKLNLDGTPVLDDKGNPVPTYLQSNIEGVARVFTGMTYAGSAGSQGNAFQDFFLAPKDMIQPMEIMADFHESGEKLLLDDVVLPANGPTQTPQDDLDAIHDTLSNHPTNAPFICKRLIQRTVTSNPTPGFVERVATVYEDNGSGVRGDFAAVFKAILLDNEARSADPIDAPTWGKQREPLLRVVYLLRALKAAPDSVSGFGIGDLSETHLQAPLNAPTVFNFFESDFSQPGEIAESGLESPEFQTSLSSVVINTANYNNQLIFNGVGTTTLDFSRYTTAAADVDTLIDVLELDFMDGRMPAAMRLILENYLPGVSTADERAKAGLYLVTTSPEFIIES